LLLVFRAQNGRGRGVGSWNFEPNPFNLLKEPDINATKIIELLEESPLFQKVKNSALATMVTKSTQVSIAAGEILLMPGQLNDHIYVVLSGRMRAQLNMDDTQPLALFGVGECVGEMSMFDDHQVSAYVIAITDCELLSIEHTEAWSVLNKSLQASHNMLALLANRIRSTDRTVAEWQANAQSYSALNYVNAVTGIYNRHWLVENIGRLILRHTGNQQPCAFVLMKIDNFDLISTGFGKLGSEQTQRSVVEALQRHLRPNDVETQIDTDQFAIFLPKTPAESANAIANRLLEEINGMIVGTPSGDALAPVKVSIGVGIPQVDDTFESLIARTLLAMHRAQT
jgi:diguanylate cyclase (GGDEF)-like protein